MTTKFKKKKLFDQKTGDAGIDITIEENGVEFGTFHVRYFNRYSQAVSRKIAMIQKRVAKEKAVKLTAIQEAQATLCHYLLTDWSGIEDEAGKPVPFNPDVAMEFFDDEDQLFILFKLIEAAGDAGNYQPDEALEIVKN